MKRYRLIARQQIINPQTHQVHDDEGLKALDGYWGSPIHEYDDSIHPTVVANELIKEYKHSPEFMPNCEYELKTVK